MTVKPWMVRAFPTATARAKPGTYMITLRTLSRRFSDVRSLLQRSVLQQQDVRRRLSRRGAKLPRPIAIDEVPARAALEIVPSLYGLHAADNRLSINERAITRRTEQLRRRRLGR